MCIDLLLEKSGVLSLSGVYFWVFIVGVPDKVIVKILFSDRNSALVRSILSLNSWLWQQARDVLLGYKFPLSKFVLHSGKLCV